jgi:short-subunit dehydrogenase
MPSVAAYSAAKGALERWAEALAYEIAPFGLGVTILVAGMFKTDIITDQTPHYGDHHGAYAAQYAEIDRRGRSMIRLASPPDRFARALARTLDERAPFARHAIGLDAQLLLLFSRVLPTRVLRGVIRLALGLPRHGALRGHQTARTPLTSTSNPREVHG